MATVFCSYSHKDERMRQQLGAHMAVLVRHGIITVWSDRVILPGKNIDREINRNLEIADIILLLISADFLASDYCYDIEVRRALELHEQGKARVVPVLLRDCDWHHAPFGRLEAVPSDGRPIKSWPDRDKGYRNIVDRLRALAADVDKGSSRWMKEVCTDSAPAPQSASTPVLEIDKLASPPKARSEWKREDVAFDFNSFLPKLAQLIEIMDDLDRHATDTAHAEGGGKINYVFDENIFELFLHPQKLAEYVSLFHSYSWNPEEHSRKSWRSINAQSALLASEYLFSGSLPGQDQSCLYTTQWHRTELFIRSLEMVYGLEQKPLSNEIARKFLFQMASLRSAAANGTTAPIGTLDHANTGILADTQTLREAGVPEDQLNTYLCTRVALEAMASEDQLTSMTQLQRMMSADFFNTIRSTDDLGIPTRDERRKLSDDADTWFDLLTRESISRSRPGQSTRSHGSLSNDALALAVIHWLAKERLKSGELTVLVTGDSLLFSTYRRWHLETCPEAPFLLRRVTQYAPMFTLGDREVVILPRPGVLDDFLDLGLYPFNLSKLRNKSSNLITLRRMFAQQISDARWTSASSLGEVFEAVFSGMATSGYQNFIQELQRLGGLWRQIETITLGLNPDLLSYRIVLSIPAAISLRRETAEISDQEVDEWLSSAILSLRREAIQLWTPMAVEVIEEFRDSLRPEEYEGAFWTSQVFSFIAAQGGRALDFTFRISKKNGFEGSRTVDGLSLSCSRDEEAAFLRQPTIAFGAAAVLAAVRRNWDYARRFADLCAAAAKLENLQGSLDRNVLEAERVVSLVAQLARRPP